MNELVAVLLERQDNGLRVRLYRDNTFGTLGVGVIEGNEYASERIIITQADKALDAYLHPFAYIGQTTVLMGMP